jgi:hypothetical protein
VKPQQRAVARVMDGRRACPFNLHALHMHEGLAGLQTYVLCNASCMPCYADQTSTAALLCRFDWFFKSRTPQELARRAETLIRLIEKEFEDANVSAVWTGQGQHAAAAAAACRAAAISRCRWRQGALLAVVTLQCTCLASWCMHVS